MITIKELAEICGVSIATISRAFTANSVIHPATKEKILKTAKELNYRPNVAARALKMSKTQTVGIIIPSIDNYFYLDVLKYIECALHKNGYRLVVSFIQYGIYDEKEALNTMRDSCVDALIFSPRNTENADTVFQLKNQMHMLQLFTAPYNDISGIVMDDKYGVRIAMDHLISRGYKRILYIGGDNRVKGYYEALAAAEIPADESLVSLNWSVSEAEICDKIKKLHPDAILGIARQAQTAWCALCALQREGIPELPFVAYDDVNWVKMFNITAVAHPLQEIAETVTQYIFACITSDSNEYTHRVIKPFLIERLTSK